MCENYKSNKPICDICGKDSSSSIIGVNEIIFTLSNGTQKTIKKNICEKCLIDIFIDIASNNTKKEESK